MSILIPFANVAVRFVAILAEVAPVVVQVLSVAVYVTVRRGRIFIGGIDAWYRAQCQDGSENYQTRFTHEAGSPEVSW